MEATVWLNKTARAETCRERVARSLFRGVCAYRLRSDPGAPEQKREDGATWSLQGRLRPQGLLRSHRLFPING